MRIKCFKCLWVEVFELVGLTWSYNTLKVRDIGEIIAVFLDSVGSRWRSGA